MSTVSNPVLAQTIENLRITDDEYRAKTDECILLRMQLRDAHLQSDNLAQQLRRQENISLSQRDEIAKLQQSLDVVLKELSSKKALIDTLQSENARLRRDLGSPVSADVARSASNSYVVKSLPTHSVDEAPKTLSAAYVEQCFSSGVSPHVDIISGLHKGHAIRVLSEPASFQQMLALCEVLRLKKLDPAMSLQAASITVLECKCATQDTFRLVAELMSLLSNLASVSLHNFGDLVAHDVACVLSVVDNISSLALPGLCVSDEGLQMLLKVVSNREQLASSPRPFTPRSAAQATIDNPSAMRLLSLADLDLSNAKVQDLRSFEMIRGSTIRSLSLRGSAVLKDNLLGEIIRSCPALESLDVSNCPSLTNDAVSFINASGSITRLNITGCFSVTRLQLFKAKELRSNLARITFLDVPEVVSMPEPITSFQTVLFSAPKVHGLTFSALAFSARELQMIADSAKALEEVAFLNCRLHQGADQFFRQMRKLTHVSLHGCKGITDQDVVCLGSSLVCLDLTDQYSLSNRSMKHLAEVCRGLRSLTLKRCANITDEGVVSLATCTDLQYLNVLGMRKLTVMALHRLISLVPGIAQVVHETIVSVGTQVDRGDVEETQRGQLALDHQQLLHAKDTGALAYLNLSPYRVPHPPAGGAQSPPSARKSAASDSQAPAAAGDAAAEDTSPARPPDADQSPETVIAL
jgi:hypothetical protein